MTVGRLLLEPTGCEVSTLFNIIHEDAELLVVNKPADLVCHPTKGDAFSSLISRTRIYLGSEGAPRLVNRLDRETSGVTIIAKTPKVAGELGRVWETRAVEKQYVAIVHGHIGDENGVIDAPLGKDENSRVAIKDCVRPDGAPAQTEFTALKRFERAEGKFSSLEVIPRTGRKHQIRIHLAHLGYPIVGDKLYGTDEDLYLALVERRLSVEQRRGLLLPNHALHARAVRFFWREQWWEFRCEPESWFLDFQS
jgi:23S rRNA pseudouridine1911/1915/1917 synthase